MAMVMMRSLFPVFICTLGLLSCGQPPREADNETLKQGNRSTTLSADTAKLSKIIDLSTYRPFNAKFKYVFIDNSGQNERLSVPGPSDSYLEAVLYFDSTAFNQIRAKYFNTEYSSPGFNKQSFNFEWLDAQTRAELLRTDTSYHGHPDSLFGSGARGKLWFLRNKILLTESTM